MFSSVGLGGFELECSVEEILGLIPLFVVCFMRHVDGNCLINNEGFIISMKLAT